MGKSRQNISRLKGQDAPKPKTSSNKRACQGGPAGMVSFI